MIATKHTPMLRISEDYQADNVTVTVKWDPAQQMDTTIITLITTTVTVSPLVPIIPTGNTSRELVISYNTEYNLSVVAVTACGNATASRKLNYGEMYNRLNYKLSMKAFITFIYS